MSARNRAADDAHRRGRRSAARLAAVQALYQLDVGGSDVESVIGEFVQHRFGAPGGEGVDADVELFTALARGAAARRGELDGLITGALDEGWTVARLELLLQAVLRAAAYELLACPGSPARVVIDEYIEVAHAFFDARVPAFVNGVLDHLAHTLRPDEFAAEGGAA